MTKRDGKSAKNAVEGLLNFDPDQFNTDGDDSNNEGRVRELEQQLADALSGENSQQVSELKAELGLLKEIQERAIVAIDKNRWQFGRFGFTRTELVPPDGLTDEEFNALGFALSGMSGSINFWLGDWANLYLDVAERKKQEDEKDSHVELSEEERHEIYEELVSQFSLESNKTLRQYSSVCRILPPSVRTDGTHWSNHELVAFLPKALKGREEEFLKTAVQKKFTKNKLKEHIASERAKLLPEKTPLVFDPKSIMGRFRNLSKLMILSNDAKITAKKKQRYLDDILAIERVLDEMKDKLKD